MDKRAPKHQPLQDNLTLDLATFKFNDVLTVDVFLRLDPITMGKGLISIRSGLMPDHRTIKINKGAAFIKGRPKCAPIES